MKVAVQESWWRVLFEKLMKGAVWKADEGCCLKSRWKLLSKKADQDRRLSLKLKKPYLECRGMPSRKADQDWRLSLKAKTPYQGCRPGRWMKTDEDRRQRYLIKVATKKSGEDSTKMTDGKEGLSRLLTRKTGEKRRERSMVKIAENHRWRSLKIALEIWWSLLVKIVDEDRWWRSLVKIAAEDLVLIADEVCR